MEFTPEVRKKLTKWIIGVVTACIVIFLGVQNIHVLMNAVAYCFDLISPLLVGLVLAFVLNVPMRYFELKVFTWKKIPYNLRLVLSCLLSLLIILGVIAGIVWLVIPELVDALKMIVETVIESVHYLSTMDRNEIAELPFGKYLLEVDWNSLLGKLQIWLQNEGANLVNRAVDAIGLVLGGVFDFFISLVFCFYILFSKKKLKEQACRLTRAWLPAHFGETFIYATSVANLNLRNFITGQSLEAVILGSLCMIGMLILGIPYAPMVGALVGVTALIPVVGAFIGAGVGAFMIVTVSPVKAVVFVVFLVILQQLEGNLIYPKVMGSRVNLPGMWILAAVTIGGGLAGPVGMLLSVPLASTVYVLLKEATAKREAKLDAMDAPEPEPEEKTEE
ncbi:MAG: AI-2E family transporter [Clostridia bacterium]|nr:AI-2E family transporter [Clostridia bacterium]